MFEFIVSSSAVYNDAALAIAASRTGAVGVVDLQFVADEQTAMAQLARVAALSHGRWGAHVDDERLLTAILAADLELETIILSGPDGDRLSRLVKLVFRAGRRAFAVATSLPQAEAAHAAGAAAVIAKGHEAGGWMGEEGSYVLLQRLVTALPLPVWVHGGIGLHTVAAAYAAGAAGAVLDGQLLLARESQLPDDMRAAISAMDGSETVTVGAGIGAPVRVYARPGLERLAQLRTEESRLVAAEEPAGTEEGQLVAAEPPAPATKPSHDAWRAAVKTAIGDGSLEHGLLPLGQDASFAADLAERFGTVGGIIAALRASISQACETLAPCNPLAEGAALAQSHGTRYPIVQGPMTRVSDRAEFAAAVSEAGALPFLALALMRAPEADALLRRTGELHGDRPWGVGVLGFVPAQLRAEQLEVVRRHRPPFVLIAGGRPDQAQELEDDGIATYLHVPSPGLLKLYLAQGARRFVFEGRECGGHVGPRTSFVLWDAMLRVLDQELPAGQACQVLFAGGIHDARSAAMVAAAAATATARGIQAGVLIGTAYLFTREATACEAITDTFQQAAIAAGDTVLLESGPGHATRCLHSPFVEHFESEKRRLHRDGVASAELRAQLEQLNIGRLRIAAKGVDHNPHSGADPEAPRLVPVERSEQWDRGMYMIGQVASLRDEVTTLADLHRDISAGSSELLEALSHPEAAEPPAPPLADVAIVGLACILPAAPDVGTFWANILGKVDAISEVPPERWDWRSLYDPDPSAPDKIYSRWGGFIDPVEFAPMALGMPPKTLSSIEPFQLLALVTAQAALRDAGYATRPFDRDRTSVILGAGGGGADLAVGYTVRSALPSLLGDAEADLRERLYRTLPKWTEDSFAGLLMNVAAGRIANRLDFGGTNYTVDAACASSLNAIGLATRDLQMGTSDMVLAGGVDALQNAFSYLCFSKTHALSPRGRCRPFDASADGIAISEGFATVVLKRLADAERDGDRIYAVIRGVGAASDGRDRSLTAPRPEGQMSALRRAYAQARFSASTVGLVEAHGTGTVAGDGAEIQALSTVFTEHGTSAQSCAVGSVKSMIGHTKATAGVVGLIKATLALHHRVLPPTIGVTEPNPKADFPNSPFYVNSEARPWLSGGADHPRRAGVSAFGFGGTDFHLVLEEYTDGYRDDHEAAVQRWPGELLMWRGTRAEIAAGVDSLASQLAQGAQPRLIDLALTLALQAPSPIDELGTPSPIDAPETPSPVDAPGTPSPIDAPGTLALVVDSIDDLRDKLETARELLAGDGTRLHTPQGIHFAQRPLAADGGIAFLFPGQGSQTVDMGRELAIAFPEARAPFELGDRLLADSYEQPLSRYVFPPPSFSGEDARRREQALTDTHVAQAALGVTELAYLRVLAALGIEPDMTAGHSYGEFVALAAAGGLDEHQLLTLSETRGRLMSDAAAGEAGAMAAVDAGPDVLGPMLTDGGVVVANLNSPTQTVISGPRERVEAAIAWCRERDLHARALPVACAFHSPHVAGAQRRFAAALKRATIAPPRIPVYSNTTGAVHAGDPAAIARVMRQHLVKPVQFVREIESMYGAGARVFVEVGPRAVLTGLTRQILGDRDHLAVSVDRPGRDGLLQLLHCLAALAAEGVPVAQERLLRGRGAERVKLERLAGDPPPASPGLWLVDGGRARPADQPIEASTSPITPKERPPVTTPSTSSAVVPIPRATPQDVAPAGHTIVGQPPPATVVVPAPVQAVEPGEALAAPRDRVSEVMAHYQRVMQQFLETERAVMLGYLGAPSPAPRVEAARAPGPRVLPAPAPPPGVLPAPAPAPWVMAPPPTVPNAVAAASAVAPVVAPVAAPPPIAAVPPPPPPTAAPPPAPEAVTAPPSQPPGNGHPTMTHEEIERQLLWVVSERTGYPAEMLELDADMEGDLGIDSIKRVEIAGTFTQGLPESQQAAFDMEELTASRTLREVIAVLETGVAAAAPAALAATGTGDTPPFESGPAETERIGRFVVHPMSAPEITVTAGLADRGAVLIIDDGMEMGKALARAFATENPVLLTGPSVPRDHREAVELAAWLNTEHGGVKALIHLTAEGEAYGGLTPLFLLTAALQPSLMAAAQAGGAAVIGVTRLGGAFGLDGGAPDGCAGHRAVGGFLKTLAQEWPAVRVKAVDLPAAPSGDAAAQVLAELWAADGLVEVGYRRGERTRLSVVPTPLGGRPSVDPIDADCVLLVTGGARGITAEVALALAEHHRPTVVLVGRTAIEPERPEVAGVSEPADLRRAMIDVRRRTGDEVTPALVEADCRRILRSREALINLTRLRECGARIDYVQCDVQDSDAFGALIDRLYDQYGRIDGVVHGAGLIEDRLVSDKQLDSLERVVATKAGSAQTLADKLRPQTLRFMVLFSSVSGRFGNRGQADYAAASEVLGGLAHELDRRWAARVVAVDWGPWSGTGMVSSALEQEFARRGVVLIGVQEGCRMLRHELACGRKGEAELVVGAATGLAATNLAEAVPAEALSTPAEAVPAEAVPVPADAGACLPLLLGATAVAAPAAGGVALLRSFSLGHDRYLDDHRMDGQAVLPFAVAMELMSETAKLTAPGRALAGLQGIRVLKGILIPEQGVSTVRVTARPRPGGDEVEVAIASPDGSRPHFRAVARLREAAAAPEPATGPAALPELAPFALTVQDAYRDLLFHGPLFQGISAIAGMDRRGSSARLRASAPGPCVAGAQGLGWLLDPVMVDSAMQVQVLWSRLHWDVTLLPAEIGGYERFDAARDGEPIRHELRIRPNCAPPLCHADHWFFGSDGRLLATLGDVVGVGTQALNRLSAAPA